MLEQAFKGVPQSWLLLLPCLFILCRAINSVIAFGQGGA
jgi:hypothetical protein